MTKSLAMLGISISTLCLVAVGDEAPKRNSVVDVNHAEAPVAGGHLPGEPALKNNSVNDLFKCLESMRYPFVPGFSYTWDRIKVTEKESPTFKGHFFTVVPYGKDIGFLVREGEKTYIAKIPNDGKNFERQLILPPMPPHILRGEWEKDGPQFNGYLRDSGAFLRNKTHILTPLFQPNEEYEKDSRRGKKASEPPPVYAKLLDDDDPTALAALKDKLDKILTARAELVLNIAAYRDIPPNYRRGNAIDENDRFVLNFGEPRLLMNKLNACRGALGPQGTKLTKLVDRLNQLLPTWQNNYNIAVESREVMQKAYREREKLREGVRSVSVPPEKE